MCIRNWLRRLLRHKREGDPICKGGATVWSVVGEIKLERLKDTKKRKLLSDWAARKIDDMIMAEARARRNILGDTIYINRISQLTKDMDKEA